MSEGESERGADAGGREQAILTCSPDFAYGSQAVGGGQSALPLEWLSTAADSESGAVIPANSTLLFEVRPALSPRSSLLSYASGAAG